MNENKDYKEHPLTKKLRFTENLHIAFWLVKDVCWCLNFKILGVLMVIPTLSVALYILLKDKEEIAEIYHNLAVLLWIIANSWWMCSEFFGYDEKILIYGLTGRNLAILPFGLGIITLLIFYLHVLPKQKSKSIK